MNEAIQLIFFMVVLVALAPFLGRLYGKGFHG